MIIIFNIVNKILVNCTYNQCTVSQRIVLFQVVGIEHDVPVIVFSGPLEVQLEHILQLHKIKTTFKKFVITNSKPVIQNCHGTF